MTRVFPSGIKPVFDLRLASGHGVNASANHPFLTLHGWKPLSELSVGNRLAVPRRLPEPNRVEPWPEQEIVMLAHLIGDGCFASSQPIHYTSGDPGNLQAVENAATHFGITPRRVPQDGWWHLYLPAPYRLTHGKRNPIAAWLDRFGLYGLRSYQKFIPQEVFSLPRPQLALFVRHLWATDGCLHLGRGKQVRLYYASTSARLIGELKMLLLRFGVLGRIKEVRKPGYRPSYHLHISGIENQLCFIVEIGVHGSRSDRLEPIVHFLVSRVAN